MKLFVILSWAIVSLFLGSTQLEAQEISSIVYAEPKTPVEKRALEELNFFLKQLIGKELPNIKEDVWDGKTPALIIGRGVYASRFISKFDRMAPEEWTVVSRPDGSIIITGGDGRGVLYGVLEFLERYAGVRFLGVNALHIPRLSRLEFPPQKELRGVPFFPHRLFSMRVYGKPQLDHMLRQRINGYDRPEFGYSDQNGSPGDNHTFHLYSMRFKERKPEYFSLDQNGKRLISQNAVGPGQLCLSHPDVRKEMKRILREFIREDQERTLKLSGKSAPKLYDISQNDNSDRCLCSGCDMLEKKNGGKSGALLDFINDIAGDIAKDFPNVRVGTFAYSYAQLPPDIPLRAAPNVRIRIALLGGEWANGCRDTSRSIHHPNNKLSKEILEKWKSHAVDLATWDYGKIYNESFPAPYTLVRGLAENMRFYASLGVKSVYMESEITHIMELFLNFQSFYELKSYLFFKLTVDPGLDEEKLIDEFMVPYYGKATEEMKNYLALLEKRMNEESGCLNAVPMTNWKFLDAAFFAETEQILRNAENAVADDPEKLRRVGRERFSIDSAHLNLWNRLYAEKKNHFPLSRDQVLERFASVQKEIEQNFLRSGEKHNPLEKVRRIDEEKLEGLRHPIPVPKEFYDKKIAGDYTFLNFTGSNNAVLKSDSEAAGGKAMYLGTLPKYGKETFRQPFEFGVYCYGEKKAIAKKILKFPFPVDQKYHWYRLSQVRLTAQSHMWAHWSWALSVAPVRNAFNPLNGSQKYDLWFSLKFEGPSHVSGSSLPDGVWLERVIVTESDSQTMVKE